ncbi:MAG: hypothetical protein ACYC3W_07085 [Candidatus Nanopelagicales bacterium]
MPESTLRRPLLTVAVMVIAALVMALSAFTLLARGTFTSLRLTDTLASGWVAVGVRAPEGQGGVVTALPVGGPAWKVEPLRFDAATAALSVNDPNGLSQAVANASRRPMAGAVILDRLAWAGLVDAVNGINVHLNHAIVVHRVDGSADIFEPGLRHLDGIAAATYVLSDPSGVRLNAAFSALLLDLPTDHNRLTGLVRSLGMSMRATVSEATVVRWLEFWQSRL